MLEDIADFLKVVTVVMVPYALCSLGIMLGGRAGVLNISGDGLMMVGASIGFLAAFFINTAIGLLLAMVSGACLGFILVFISEKWKVNQFILGIVIFIFGMGISDLMYKVAIGMQLTPPLVQVLRPIAIPGLSQIPIIGVLLNQNILVYITYALVVVLYFVLYRTRIGLNTRSVGEDPKAADSAGINVFRRRLACVTIGGMMMGLAGFTIPLTIAGTFTPGGMMTGGRGFMAIGLTIFGSFRPERVFLAAFLFAGIETFSYRLVLIPGMPYQFFLMLPFITILVVMALFYKVIEYPAAIGRPYSRE